MLTLLTSAVGLATNLYSDKDKYQDFTLLEIVVELTEEGESSYLTVCEIVFAYLDLLKKNIPSKVLYEECAKLASIDFTFKEKSVPSKFALQLTQNIHVFKRFHFFHFVLEISNEGYSKGTLCME